MTNFLPPPDRETFEKEIDELFEQVRGSKDSFARFLNVHPGTVSKRLNPYNEDHVSSFYQELAQDSIHISLWKLGGDVGRSTAALLSKSGLYVSLHSCIFCVNKLI